MHGIFPTHNKYYQITEIFPFLSKREIKEVFYPERKPKNVTSEKNYSRKEEEN
jgi:hypothetical protein